MGSLFCLFSACCLLIHCLAQNRFSGGFALTDCGALFFLILLFPPSLCFHLMCLCIICVCAAEGKLQVATGNSLSSLFLFFYSSLLFSHPLEDCIYVFLIFGSVVLCWLGVILLATVVSSQASSRMSMRRL